MLNKEQQALFDAIRLRLYERRPDMPRSIAWANEQKRKSAAFHEGVKQWHAENADWFEKWKRDPERKRKNQEHNDRQSKWAEENAEYLAEWKRKNELWHRILKLQEEKHRSDEDVWRSTEEGEHFLLGEGGEIKAGFGGKFTGKKPSEVWGEGKQAEQSASQPEGGQGETGQASGVATATPAVVPGIDPDSITETAEKEAPKGWQAQARAAKAELEKKFEGYSPEARTYLDDNIQIRMDGIADSLSDELGSLSGKGKIEINPYTGMTETVGGHGKIRVKSEATVPEIADMAEPPGRIRDAIRSGKETPLYIEIKRRVAESMLDDPHGHIARIYGEASAREAVGDKSPREFWESQAKAWNRKDDDVPF